MLRVYNVYLFVHLLDLNLLYLCKYSSKISPICTMIVSRFETSELRAYIVKVDDIGILIDSYTFGFPVDNNYNKIE